MVLVTLGEITGIGPEIVLKAIRKFPPDEVKIIGSKAVLEKQRERMRTIWRDFDYHPYLLDLLPGVDFTFSEPTEKTARFAYESLKIACSLIKEGRAQGIVTAPISKRNMRSIGFNFPGQTEFFAREFGVKNYAFLAYAKEIKVAFLTLHLTLKKVASVLRKDLIIEKGLLLYDFLIRFEGVRRPKIGVFAFNPHGEEFSLGEEERMKEGINRLRCLGIEVSEPIGVDSFPLLRERYDGFLSPYHDQGILVVKASATAPINTTLGLPFIRTSPLHGTAFDIAGKGVADFRGMEEAIRLCWRWVASSPLPSGQDKGKGSQSPQLSPSKPPAQKLRG
jgi:4-hydroxythreonine-4-phosphate dehydrogenase